MENTAPAGTFSYDEAIGRRVRLLREQERENRGRLRQDDVAKAMRVYGADWTRSTVWKVEQGKRTLTAPELWLLTRVLECDVGDLLDWTYMEHARLASAAGRNGVLHELGEADRNAARRLALSQERFAEIATALWGRSLSEERDRRLSDRAVQPDGDGVHAVRGHIVRELTREIEYHLQGLGS